MANYRLFERVDVNIKVMCEIVNRDEKELECTENAFESNITNINILGVGIDPIPKCSKSDLEDLLLAKKKLRLNFELNPGKGKLCSFALLIKTAKENNIAGLEFIDIPVKTFVEIRDTVDNMLAEVND